MIVSPEGPLPPEVTVIIPVFNARFYLSEQLEALDRQYVSVSWELLLVDNGSSDGSRQLIDAWAATREYVRVLDASMRRGPAHARNVGANGARGRLLLYTDADDVVGPGWIAAMLKASTQADLLAGCDVEHPSALAVQQAKPAHPAVSGGAFLPFARGGNLAVGRSTLQQLGGWNEEWIRGQDVELSWRAQCAGRSLYTVPDARVHYRRPEALGAILAQQFEFGRRAPELHRAFGAFDAPEPQAVPAISRLLSTLLRWPSLLLPSRRRAWLIYLAGTWGRAVGTLWPRPAVARERTFRTRRWFSRRPASTSSTRNDRPSDS